MCESAQCSRASQLARPTPTRSPRRPWTVWEQRGFPTKGPVSLPNEDTARARCRRGRKPEATSGPWAKEALPSLAWKLPWGGYPLAGTELGADPVTAGNAPSLEQLLQQLGSDISNWGGETRKGSAPPPAILAQRHQSTPQPPGYRARRDPRPLTQAY